MFLQITTTHQPATDLGYLLHKNPDRMHELELAFGKGRLFFPEAREASCTAVLALDIDPVALVRGKGAGEGLLDQYVNDRPYAASSFLSVAMGRLMREAISGRSKERQALADTAIPLEAVVSPLPVGRRAAWLRDDSGTDLVTRLFAPLGYGVTFEQIAMDPQRPDWGVSPYATLTHSGTVRLSELLTHWTSPAKVECFSDRLTRSGEFYGQNTKDNSTRARRCISARSRAYFSNERSAS